MYGAVELGGTKIICGIGRGNTEIIKRCEIETRDPQSSLQDVARFFRNEISKHGELMGIGLACFGPIDLNLDSPTFGTILSTPKAGWSNFSVMEFIKEEFSAPTAITTDVNAALLAEHRFGAAQDVRNAVYVTIGTGIGAGIMVNGNFVNGFLHPEIGHMRVPTHGVKGICPFHANCLEGLASGPAILARTGQPAPRLPEDHPVWDAIASNLGDMCNNLLMTLAPERIVLGGGVMSKTGLLEKIKEQLERKLNGYLPLEKSVEGLEGIVVRAELADVSGLVGALLIAQQAADQS